jgi:hypothetical protein
MRSTNSVSTAVYILLLCGGSAAPQDAVTPIPGIVPASVTFDAADGKYHQTRWDIPCTANVITGKTRINALHDGDSKWIPSVSVFLNSRPSEPGPVQHYGQLFVLRFMSRFTNPNALASFEKAATGPVDTQYFKLPLSRGRPLSFMISWEPPGIIMAAIDRGQKIDFPIDRSVQSISFAVSGANAAFSDVQLSHSGPENPDCAADPAKN